MTVEIGRCQNKCSGKTAPRLHVDHDHGQRLQRALYHQVVRVIVEHDALDAVVERHACADGKQHHHDDFLPAVL